MRHFHRYKERGQSVPVAVVLGGDPALTYAATAPLPDGIDELVLAGFLRRRAGRAGAVQDAVDLEVPADADFVLEGYVDPTEPLIDEGPFGDHTGYYTPRRQVSRVPRHRGDAAQATRSIRRRSSGRRRWKTRGWERRPSGCFCRSYA